jgi:uncharacterized protein (TIGR00255 family)
MTGYGRGIAEHAGVRATVDIRAVNHRFLDIKLRGSAVSPGIEDAIATRVRGALERGAIAISVHVESARDGGGPRIDAAAAKRAYDALAQLAAQLGVAGPELALVLAQPGVIVEPTPESSDEPIAIAAALDSALVQLEQMRAAEGAALATELGARLDELAAVRLAIATRAATVPQLVSKRLHERVKRLLDAANDGTTVDPARLAQEVAMLAERADVTEELVRLASHIDQMRALLAADGASGRRLDFLVQEIGRELNTIGSKSTVAEISAAVVDGKAVLEKIREQVQNVE